MRRRRVLGTLAAGMSAVVLGPAMAAPPYPDVPPDPAHPDRPHAPLFSPGHPPSLAMLVIVVELSDAPAPPGRGTATDIARRYFGGRPSVADYWSSVSGGRFELTPARESQGTVDDGVVFVDGGDVAGYFGDFIEELRNSLVLADPHVDFAAYDDDADGAVENSELAIVIARPPRPGRADNGGAARNSDWGAFDERRLGLSVVATGLATNVITIAHEVGHIALHLEDWYGMGIGFFDVAGPTVTPIEDNRRPSGVFATHLGWARPRVITGDGWIELPPATSMRDPAGAILYDPAVGIHDHVFLENRNVVGSAETVYDEAASDRGLVAYRVRDDRFFTGTPEHLRSIELILPRGGRTPGCVDDDLDGLHDEDPGSPRRAIFDGRLDLNRNGRADTADDGKYLDKPVFDGYFDLARGPGDPGDGFAALESGQVGSIAVIAGRIDADGDGDADEHDDSAITGDPWQEINNDAASGDSATDEDPPLGCYAGSAQDAWDPADSRTPQRTIEGPLPDGTRAPLAVRAIWPAEDDGTIRLFADVPGPGVMVDTYPPPTIDSGRANRVEMRVRNTGDAGEAPDTFQVSVAAPSGWSAGTTTVTLPPATETTVELTITPPLPHVGGERRLEVVARSTTRPGVESTTPLTVHLRMEADADEPDDSSPALLTLPAHTHGADPFGGRSESWTRTITGRNFHEPSDRDRVFIRIPDPGNEADGGHSFLAGLPRCGSTSTDGGTLVTSDVLEGRVVPRPRVALDSSFIELLTDGRRRVTPWRGGGGIVECVGDRFPEARLGLLPGTSLLPEYQLELSYRFEATLLPKDARWAAEREQMFGVGSLIHFLCPGGTFPDCLGLDGPQLGFDLEHPLESTRDCKNGCPDHLVFAWAKEGALEMTFDAVAGTEVELFDIFGTAVATAGKQDQAPSLAVADGDRIGLVLSVPKLKPGLYALVVRGPAGSLQLLAERPAPAMQTSLLVDAKGVPEAARTYSRTLTVTNPDEGRTLLVYGLVDELGELSDGAACQLPAEVPPGGKLTCTYDRPTPQKSGTHPVFTKVSAGLGGISTRDAARAELSVQDELPAAEVTLGASEQKPPEGGGPVTLTAQVRNHGSEPLTLGEVELDRFDDLDGDGFASPRELSAVKVSCQGGGTLQPGASFKCPVEVDVDGPPWSDPTFTFTAGVRDDDGNGQAAAARTQVDILAVAARRLDPAASRLSLSVLPVLTVEDGIDGYAPTPTGDTLLTATARFVPAGAAVLVSALEASLEEAEGTCAPVQEGPVIVDGPTLVRLTCHVTGELPDGARLRVSAAGQDLELEAAPSRAISIDVMPGSEENPINTGKQGKIPVAVLTAGGFDALGLQAQSACFGRSGSKGACGTLLSRGRPEDVDGDGDLDLVLFFEVGETGFEPAFAAEGCLTGRTGADVSVRGCDVVRPH